VDADPELAEARVVDSGDQVHPDQPEDHIEALAVEVVMGAAGNILGGRVVEGVERDRAERDRREPEADIHVGEAEALGDARPHGERLGVGAAGSGRVHHPPVPSSSSEDEPSASSPANKASRILRAAGAAASTPNPPSSIVTKVMYCGSGYGASTPY